LTFAMLTPRSEMICAHRIHCVQWAQILMPLSHSYVQDLAALEFGEQAHCAHS
jgi:hypothetical protein